MKLVSLDELGRLPEIGERVLIVSDRSNDEDCLWNSRGGMDHHLGTYMTVRDIYRDTRMGFRAKMIEDQTEFDGDGWSWYPDMIEGVLVDIDTDLDDDTDLWETQSFASLLM